MTSSPALWSYLAAAPLTWLTVTLLAFLGASIVSRALQHSPLANPVLVSVCIIAMVLWLTGTRYDSYFEGAQFIHFLLGPATMALAVPLFDNFGTIRRLAVPILLALLVGSSVAVLSAILLAQALGLPEPVILSLSPKSATAPVAPVDLPARPP